MDEQVKKPDYTIYGRRYGKRAKTEEWIKEERILGHHVAVATLNGLFCAHCDKEWKECGGTC